MSKQIERAKDLVLRLIGAKGQEQLSGLYTSRAETRTAKHEAAVPQ